MRRQWCAGTAETSGEAVLADPFDLLMGSGADTGGDARGPARLLALDKEHHTSASQQRCSTRHNMLLQEWAVLTVALCCRCGILLQMWYVS